MKEKKTYLQITPLSSWLRSSETFPVIAGPCSAETREQVLETAKALAKINHVALFRAGVWKPRTRPHSFSGRGPIALDWLIEAKKVTKIPLAVEVACASHVETCLEKNIDVLWIGARTVVNPFSVQEIATALSGVDIPVLVKNPLVPDVELWIGALERINQAGIHKLAAVHRGFAFYKAAKLRYPPEWKIPLEFKRLCPQVPLLCDPSHICGQKSHLLSISQRALELAMDGLMIESHINPESALSDKEQQVTPKELVALLKKIDGVTKAPLPMRPNLKKVPQTVLEP